MTEGKHQGPDHASPYPVSRLGAKIELVDVAAEIQRADEMVGSVAHGKLDVIAKQIRALQAEAKDILEQARRDLELHHAQCSFSKRVGGTYHLYERPDGALYFSMLSPVEWGGTPPHAFQGSFRLEVDRSWTPVEEVS